LTGLTKFKDAVEEVKRIRTESKTVDIHLEIIDVVKFDGNSTKGIGVFFSTSESSAKQFGWIPKELIGKVESMCKETLNGLKGLDISLICFKKTEISSSFTKISAVIKIITPN
jgi:hypothetical protein